MPKVSNERLEDVIQNLERWSAATGRGDDAVMLEDLRHYRELRRMNEWVSVKDRLPEFGSVVEAMSEDKSVTLVHLIDEHREDDEFNPISTDLGSFEEFYTHWRPLPPSPEEAKSA